MAMVALAFSAQAQPAVQAGDGLSWLGRIAGAAQKLNYAGVFVYQNGQHSESSRIVHAVDRKGERERLEALDGSPREVLRANGEVRCYLPSQRIVLLENEGKHKAFPAALPASLSSLADNYVIKKGEVGRVAGLESQEIILQPKDNLRYGHLLWADVGSGLLLRARTVDQRNATLEQFSFTQVRIGGSIDEDALRSRLAAKAAEWRIHDSRASESVADDGGWIFRDTIPGFRKTAGMKRHLRSEAAEVVHLVFSDGMAAISVFIEPLHRDGKPPEAGFSSAGATGIYKRVAGDYLVTVLGEVPPQTLKRLGDGIEQQRK